MNFDGLVSVVIPCYNQSHFLGEAIESINKQTYKNFEIIVIDDGSTDVGIDSVINKFGDIKLIRQKNLGLAAARNTGLRESNGEFIIFLDSDDRLLPKALEIGVNSLRENPECAFVSGFCRQIDVDGNLLPIIKQPTIKDGSDHYEAFLRNNYIWTPANIMFRHDIFNQISDFDVSISPTADYDLYLRIARQFSVHQHGEVVSEYRQHKASMSSNYLLMLRHILKVFEAQKEFVENNADYRKAINKGRRYYLYIYGKLIFLGTFTLLIHFKGKEVFQSIFIFIDYLVILFKILPGSYLK